MDEQLLGYVELLRGVFEPARVRTGTPASADELANVEYKLGLTLPDEYKAAVSTLGYLCAGDAGELVIYGVAPIDHDCPHEVDLLHVPPSVHETVAVIPLVRLAIAGEPTRVLVLDAHGQLRLLVGAQLQAAESVRAELQRMMRSAVEARMEAIAEAAGAGPALGAQDDGEPGAGQASVQLFAVPRDVVAALKKEPAVVDEITLYTSVEEFREQTVAWEKTLGPAGSPTTKELVRRMRWLLGQRGIAKLRHFITGEAEVPRWTDAIVACFGDAATESLALRGKTALPSEGTDTIRILAAGEVKQVAAALDGAEQRLRAGYQPEVLRARGLYNLDAPNEAAFLEELVALWDTVEDGIRDAARQECGWIIRRTEGR
jgi:hypothetical protein